MRSTRFHKTSTKLAVKRVPIRLWRDGALRASAPVSAPYIAARTWLDGSHLANPKYHIFVISGMAMNNNKAVELQLTDKCTNAWQLVD